MSALARFSEIPVARVFFISIALTGVYYIVSYDSGEKFRLSATAAISQKAELAKELLKIDQEIAEINQLKAAQARDSERLNTLLDYIPEKLTKTEMMRTLSNEAKSVGVSINGIKDNGGVGKKHEFYEEVGVDVDLAGNFAQLMLFLSNLTKLNQILSVENLDLKFNGSGDGDGLGMSAAIRAYRYAPKAIPSGKGR